MSNESTLPPAQNIPDSWLFPAYKADEHTMALGARGDYLNVQNRMVWFLTDQRRFIHDGVAVCPYVIDSELIEHDAAAKFAQFRVHIRDVLGNEATAYGSETKSDFGDYLEKAETKAKGRALLDLGYGTAFVYDDEGERVVDSPRQNSQAGAKRQEGRQEGRQNAAASSSAQTQAPARTPEERAAIAAKNRKLGEQVGLVDMKTKDGKPIRGRQFYTQGFLDYCHITPDADGAIRSTDEQADAWGKYLREKLAERERIEDKTRPANPRPEALESWQPETADDGTPFSFDLADAPALAGTGRPN